MSTIEQLWCFSVPFSVLTRLSVTAADGGTLDTDRFLIRGICTVTGGSRKVLDGELGSMLTTSLRSKAVQSPRETSGARETSRCYMRRRLLGESVLCVVFHTRFFNCTNLTSIDKRNHCGTFTLVDGNTVSDVTSSQDAT